MSGKFCAPIASESGLRRDAGYLRRRGGARLHGVGVCLYGADARLSVFVLQKCNPRCGARLCGLEYV
ncbi:MAG: hypothetical protein DBX55_05185 [Verrucomicrobia bacterium]|nr:MAG: hypothetical protein DBX55_05185 [Verrucomicrobiota bacterium]